jgi:hypothetical protein
VFSRLVISNHFLKAIISGNVLLLVAYSSVKLWNLRERVARDRKSHHNMNVVARRRIKDGSARTGERHSRRLQGGGRASRRSWQGCHVCGVGSDAMQKVCELSHGQDAGRSGMEAVRRRMRPFGAMLASKPTMCCINVVQDSVGTDF